jgi:hypothetical protein
MTTDAAVFDKVMACLEAPRGKPFNGKEALDVCKRVLAVAELHEKGLQEALGAVERKKANAIATALGEARKKIEEALELPNLAYALEATWDMAQYYDEPVVYLRRTASFLNVVDGLAALEEVAGGGCLAPSSRAPSWHRNLTRANYKRTVPCL